MTCSRSVSRLVDSNMLRGLIGMLLMAPETRPLFPVSHHQSGVLLLPGCCVRQQCLPAQSPVSSCRLAPLRCATTESVVRLFARIASQALVHRFNRCSSDDVEFFKVHNQRF